jgi:hypothetical protein
MSTSVYIYTNEEEEGNFGNPGREAELGNP